MDVLTSHKDILGSLELATRWEKSVKARSGPEFGIIFGISRQRSEITITISRHIMRVTNLFTQLRDNLWLNYILGYLRRAKMYVT